MCGNTREADRTVITRRIVAAPASTLSYLLQMQPCADAATQTGCSKQAVGTQKEIHTCFVLQLGLHGSAVK